MWKVGQKYPIFSNERHFEIWFPNRKQFHFSEENFLRCNLHKKRDNFASDYYIFPKTRTNKNKQWNHLGALNMDKIFVILVLVSKVRHFQYDTE